MPASGPPDGPEIPRAFFIILDVVFLMAAFSTAYLLAPSIKNLILEFGWLPTSWELALAPEVGGEFRPLEKSRGSFS